MFGDTPTPAENVSLLDILSDPIPEKHYKESEVRTALLYTHKRVLLLTLLNQPKKSALITSNKLSNILGNMLWEMHLELHMMTVNLT